ncbi:MAG: iron ABC transporter permease [Spirochaetaceae bacterium]|nr:MAG: iron ABC transporter permease [Spirochaetaceae bacterium]
MPEVRHRTAAPTTGIAVLTAGLVVAFIAALALGAVRIPVAAVVRILVGLVSPGGIDPAELEVPLRRAYAIVYHIRFPRAVAALFAGAALAVSGAAVQGLFRNPMASPDILGISAGSSLGAVLAIVSGVAIIHPLALPGASFVGALAAATFVYTIATSRVGTHLIFVILAGLAVSSLLSGLVSAVLVFAEEYALSQFIFWTMGGLEGRTWANVVVPIPFIVVLVVALSLFANPLNLLSLGEEQAHSLGVRVEAVKVAILVLASMATAMAITLAGPIAFIGLMVPHLVRMVTGPNHRTLLPYSALAGAIFLLLCDVIARLLFAPYEIKTGIVTAVIGGPYFIFLIIRYQRRGTV